MWLTVASMAPGALITEPNVLVSGSTSQTGQLRRESKLRLHHWGHEPPVHPPSKAGLALSQPGRYSWCCQWDIAKVLRGGCLEGSAHSVPGHAQHVCRVSGLRWEQEGRASQCRAGSGLRA